MNNVINYCFHLSFIFQINKWSELRVIPFDKPVSSSKSRLIIGPLHVTPLLEMIIGGMKGQTMAPRIKKPFDSFLIWFNLRTGIVAAARWNESGGTPFFTGENPEEYHLNRLQLVKDSWNFWGESVENFNYKLFIMTHLLAMVGCCPRTMTILVEPLEHHDTERWLHR